MNAMSSFRYFLAAIFVFAGFTAAFCQTEISDPGAKQICASVKEVETPAADRPTPAEEKSLANCSSVDMYFGFGEAADPVKARKCAFAEVDRGEKSLVRGKSILMMVYANGKGVPRNLDAALKMACTLSGAPGDAAGRVHQLDRFRKSNWAGDNFSVCDHSSGRELYEQCASLQERSDKVDRDQKFNALAARWTPAQQKAFHSFMQEAEKFFRVQAGNGVNLEGTFEVQEEAFLNNNLLSALEQFERGELPEFSPEEARQAEAEENAAYRRTQSGPVARWGTITREGARKSEEEWRRYAGAWIFFARQKYPSVSVQNWKAWLNQERVNTFNRFLR
jgi:hypothetical protein